MNNNNNKNSETSNILVGYEARNKFRNAIINLSKAVIDTLGPNGCCSIINNGYDKIRVTKDGVTVARALTSEDKFEDTFLSLMKEAGESVNEKSGDGTTTCILLMKEFIVLGMQKIELGYSQRKLLQEIDNILKIVSAKIKEQSIIPSSRDLKNVATVSANNDKVLGELVYKAITQLGEISKHYMISVEESKSIETSLEFTEGIKVDAGYLSPYFVTDNSKSIEMHNVEILIFNDKITSQDFVVKFLEYLTIKNKAGVIICDEIEKNLLGTIIVNNYQKIVKVVAVKAPSSGNEKLEILKDIAVLVNAKIYDSNQTIEEEVAFCSTHLGQCRKVIITQTQTSFIGGTCTKESINEHASSIQQQIANLENSGTRSGIQIEKLQERYSMLRGGVAVIKVGGDTEIEIGEKKDRVLDAVSSARAGKDGILPGGGTALLRVAIWLENEIIPVCNDETKVIAYKIFAKVLKKPIEQILINSGKQDKIAIIIKEITESKDMLFGYDAVQDKLYNLQENGIVDATESVLQILYSAVQISKIGLSLSSIIIKKSSDNSNSIR